MDYMGGDWNKLAAAFVIISRRKGGWLRDELVRCSLPSPEETLC
jgi:hypothetical protein